jgi:hypothetical protein
METECVFICLCSWLVLAAGIVLLLCEFAVLQMKGMWVIGSGNIYIQDDQKSLCI